MVDVDGVLVHGRPEGGLHWSESIEMDLGLSPATLQREFFDPHWGDIVVGRAGLMDHLPAVLERIAPQVTPEQLVAYWFRNDAHLDRRLLADLASIRATGVRVYLATNQEHLRAAYLMETIGLAQYVDGIFYSAQLGCKKPSVEFFRAISERLRVAPRELMLIDDLADNVSAASRVGWRAFHWSAGATLRSALG